MLGIWRRAAGASRWRSASAAGAICPNSQQPEVKVPIFHDQDLQKLQQKERRNSTAAGVGSGCESLRRLGVQRRFSSSFISAIRESESDRRPDGNLLHVLRCEIIDLVKKSQNITARNPPRPFKMVKDEPGELEITLKRIYGLEDISMSCILQLVPRQHRRKAEIGEDPDARTKMLQLTVAITKGSSDPVLKIRCECYRDGFAIHQVDLESEDGEQSVYRPYFSESKRELVNNFQVFLYNRGLNADLAKYIEQHLENKRLLKSVSMVKDIEGFIE